MSNRLANPALSIAVAVVGLSLTLLAPVVADAQQFGMSLQIGTSACVSGLPCDSKVLDTGVAQITAASESFRSEVIQVSLQTALAVASADVTLGTLSTSLAASATGSGTNSASATVDATWRDSFIAVGPPGALLAYHVTFAPSASIHTTSDFDHCRFNISFASIQAALSGTVTFGQSITDCSPPGAGLHKEEATFSVFAGEPFGFQGTLFARTGPVPGGTASSLDASHTVHFYLDPVTPGATYTSASGLTYFTPAVAPPTITTGPAGPTNKTEATFTFTDVDPSVTFLCALDDNTAGAFAPCTSPQSYGTVVPLAPGSHTFYVRAQDVVGSHSLAVPFSWTIDLDAPAITFTGVPPDPSNSASASFSFFATEPSTFACQLDAEAARNCEPDPTDPAKGTESYTGLLEGSHIFAVTASDPAGNVSPAFVVAWRIDLTPPTLTITSAPFNPTNANTASFAFTASEPSTFPCQLSGPLVQDSVCGIVPSTDGTATYSGLGEGTYTFTVTAEDAGGNLSSRSYTWVIDQTPPVVIFGAPTPAPNADGWNNTSVSIPFVSSDSNPASSVTTTPASPLVLSTEGDAATGTVTASDDAGNSKTFTSPAVRLDQTPPNVTITTPASGATFVVGTTVRATYACTDALSGTASCAGPVPSGSAIDTAAVGVFTFSVTGTDLAGNATTTAVTYAVVSAATAPDLVEAVVSALIAIGTPGLPLVVTDTVRNQGTAGAPASVTRYYLATTPRKSATDVLLTGNRAVQVLPAGGTSTGTVAATVPATTPLGTYFLLACADDTTAVVESNELNNCTADAATVQITRADLVETSVSNPPATAARGGSFSATDTVRNQGAVPSGSSTTRYYLSPSPQKSSAAVLLAGQRKVPPLLPIAPLNTSSGTLTVTIPATAPRGTYFLLTCADDLAAVAETSETNNCLASTGVINVNR